MHAGRNEPCPCGSGQKYKKCCWAKDRAAEAPRPPASPAHVAGAGPAQLAATPRPALASVPAPERPPTPLDALFERFEQAPLDEKLSLARDAARLPGFTEEDAFELGNTLYYALGKQARLETFDALLDGWERDAPEVARGVDVLDWRVRRALQRGDADVQRWLLQLVQAEGPRIASSPGLIEWCLWHGREADAAAALEALWPHVRQGGLFDWVQDELLQRLLLLRLDLAGPSPEAQHAALDVPGLRAGGVQPEWREQVLTLRTGARAFTPPAGGTAALRASPVQMQGLVMALEARLRTEAGWPRARTQLVQPRLAELLLAPEPAVRRGPKPKKTKEQLHQAGALLPAPSAIVRWLERMEEACVFHPHAFAAPLCALPALGEYARTLGLVEPAELAAWRKGLHEVRDTLARGLNAPDDPALPQAVREALEA